MRSVSVVYVVTLGLVLLAIAGVLHLGASLPPPGGTPSASVEQQEAVSSLSIWEAMAAGLRTNLDHPLSHLFLQLLVIIGAARLAGSLFARLGQPAVVGEMVAGIVLGPSVFGWLAPQAFSFVFPEPSLGALRLFSQIGVCLFMFVVGMELDIVLVRARVQSAVLVSHVSIVLPYLLGVLLALLLFSHLAGAGTTFTAFALFMGISMSITAFPVLARILQERQMTRTMLGGTAIACAAVDDVTAWSILAFVVAIGQASSVLGAGLKLLLVLGFVGFMILGVRRLLPRWIGEAELSGDAAPSNGTLAIILGVVVASALSTEIIGIHSLFGAFLAGAIVPDRHGFRHSLSVRVESLSSVLLLPLFFVFTGLRTQLGLLNDGASWLVCALVIAVATAGKLGGSALAARFTGMGWRDSLQLGALMNTRGLMELIALNVGYDLGILSPTIFSMLVIMALSTTMMTGPLLTLFGAKSPVVSGQVAPSQA